MRKFIFSAIAVLGLGLMVTPTVEAGGGHWGGHYNNGWNHRHNHHHHGYNNWGYRNSWYGRSYRYYPRSHGHFHYIPSHGHFHYHHGGW